MQIIILINHAFFVYSLVWRIVNTIMLIACLVGRCPQIGFVLAHKKVTKHLDSCMTCNTETVPGHCNKPERAPFHCLQTK